MCTYDTERRGWVTQTHRCQFKKKSSAKYPISVGVLVSSPINTGLATARLQSTSAVRGALTKHQINGMNARMAFPACNLGAVGWRAYKAPNQRYECAYGIPRLQFGGQVGGALTKHACS